MTLGPPNEVRSCIPWALAQAAPYAACQRRRVIVFSVSEPRAERGTSAAPVHIGAKRLLPASESAAPRQFCGAERSWTKEG